jgi:hypothetical protein
MSETDRAAVKPSTGESGLPSCQGRRALYRAGAFMGVGEVVSRQLQSTVIEQYCFLPSGG